MPAHEATWPCFTRGRALHVETSSASDGHRRTPDTLDGPVWLLLPRVGSERSTGLFWCLVPLCGLFPALDLQCLVWLRSAMCVGWCVLFALVQMWTMLGLHLLCKYEGRHRGFEPSQARVTFARGLANRLRNCLPHLVFHSQSLGRAFPLSHYPFNACRN